MSDPRLREALARESERVEWKRSSDDTGDTKKILHAVCALANDLGAAGDPGFLVLGVEDDGTLVGVDASDQAQQRLASRLTSIQIVPNPSVSITAHHHEGVDVLLVEVQPYPVPPVVEVDRVAYVRVGTTTRRATDADLNRLRERRPEHLRAFDVRIAVGTAVDDLDLVRLQALYADARATDADLDSFPAFENWLGQRDLARPSGSGWVPTNAAVLVHGRDPQSHLPGAIVEFVRYAGMEPAGEVSSRRTITGRLPDQLEALYAQLQNHLADVPEGSSGMRDVFVPEYPLDALKELARNLIQHRLYEGTHAPGRVSWLDDRIVFNNPGAPYGQASQGEFGAHSDYRNPSLTKLLLELGYVERLGRGIQRVRALLQKNRNPPLEVETDGFTTVVVRKRP